MNYPNIVVCKAQQNDKEHSMHGIRRSKMQTTHIPSNQDGNFTSSMENRAFNSGVDTNFRRGAEGADMYFLPTG